MIERSEEGRTVDDSLWSWFCYRLFGEGGFPWPEFLVSIFVGASLVGMGVFVGWITSQ